MTIIWCTVPEIWSVTDRIFYFGPFLHFYPLTTQKIKILKKWKNTWRYYHFTQVYHKWQSYDVWFLRYQVWWTEFFIILDHFLPFYHPRNNLKNQNFEKLKKSPWDIIIWWMCTINDNYMMYSSLDMKDDRKFFCHFEPFFALLNR